MTSLEFRESPDAEWCPVFGDYDTLEQAERAVATLNAMPEIGWERYRVAQ